MLYTIYNCIEPLDVVMQTFKDNYPDTYQFFKTQAEQPIQYPGLSRYNDLLQILLIHLDNDVLIGDHNFDTLVKPYISRLERNFKHYLDVKEIVHFDTFYALITYENVYGHPRPE